MKKRFKRIQIFLALTISLFILAFPAYLRCTQFSQTKFASSDLRIENLDQEEVSPDNEKELKVFGPTNFLVIFVSDTNLFEQSLYLFSHTLSLRHKTFVLRC